MSKRLEHQFQTGPCGFQTYHSLFCLIVRKGPCPWAPSPLAHPKAGRATRGKGKASRKTGPAAVFR